MSIGFFMCFVAIDPLGEVGRLSAGKFMNLPIELATSLEVIGGCLYGKGRQLAFTNKLHLTQSQLFPYHREIQMNIAWPQFECQLLVFDIGQLDVAT